MKSEGEELVNIAYIDGANLDKALRLTLLWEMDYGRFRKWLIDKYKIKRAYIFIGLIPKYKNLYNHLQGCGFELIFKDVLYDMGKAKGNCDTDLVMQAMTDLYEGDLDKAVIVASDGDYAPLIKVLSDKNKLETILSPAPSSKCSILLKRIGVPIAYLDDQKNLLKEKNPRRR